LCGARKLSRACRKRLVGLGRGSGKHRRLAQSNAASQGWAVQVRSRLPTLTLVYLSTHSAAHQTWELGVTSESQNNPVGANGVHSAGTQSVRILRKIKKAPKA